MPNSDNFLSKVVSTSLNNAMRGSDGEQSSSGLPAVGDAMQKAMGGDTRSALNRALNGSDAESSSDGLAGNVRQKATEQLSGGFKSAWQGGPDTYEANRAQERERTQAMVSNTRKAAGYGWRGARWVGGRLLGAMGWAVRGLRGRFE